MNDEPETEIDRRIKAYCEHHGIRHMPWQFPRVWDPRIESARPHSEGAGATMMDQWIPQGQALRRRIIEELANEKLS